MFVDIGLFFLCPQVSFLPVPPSQGPISLDWEEWDATHTKVDAGKFHVLLTFPGKSVEKVAQERKAEFAHFVFVFQGPSLLLSFMAG